MGSKDYNCIMDTGRPEHVRITAESNGYQRIATIVGWHPKAERELGRVHIQVGSRPMLSFAKFEVWREAGWIELFSLPTAEWWRNVPGHNRTIDENSKHEQATNRLILEIVEYAEVFAQQADL